MKKIKKILTIGLAILLMICMSVSLVGCGSCFTRAQEKEEKYFNEYMSKIPTDISGYQFCDSYEVGATKIENMSGDFIVQGVEINLNEFELTFNDETIEINAEFINERTEVYRKIDAMWHYYREKEPPVRMLYSRVNAIMIFENRILIFTNGITMRLWGGCINQYPITMYMYDILADDIYYLGYYNNATPRYDSVIDSGELGFKYEEEKILP